MSDISSKPCMLWILGVCAVIIVVGLIILLVYSFTGKLSASPVYLPGENIASPLERYDELNPEYAALVDMNKRRVAAELRRKSKIVDVSEQISTKPPEPGAAVTKEDVAKISHDMSEGQKNALKMYLGGPLDTEAKNANVDPMYSVYRDTNYVIQ